MDKCEMVHALRRRKWCVAQMYIVHDVQKIGQLMLRCILLRYRVFESACG